MRTALSRSLVILVSISTITATAVWASESDPTTNLITETENDAGSGGDAPPLLDQALRLQGPGSYQGTLTKADTDWFVHGPGSAAANCAELTADAHKLRTTQLHLLTASGLAGVQADGTAVTVGYASSAIQDVFIGLANDEDDGKSKYDFTSSVFTFTSGDGGLAGDASDGLESALPVTAGCVPGTVQGTQGDQRDAYSFAGAAGDRVVISMAQADSGEALTLSLVAPDGTTVAQAGHDGAIGHTLATGGTWYVAIDRPASLDDPLLPSMGRTSATTEVDTEYQVGICRPYCVLL